MTPITPSPEIPTEWANHRIDPADIELPPTQPISIIFQSNDLSPTSSR